MIALGLHSHCSLMRGTASPRALCRRVRQLGYTAAALTDTNNLYGLWPFLAACADEGLTPVIGAELRSTSGRLFALVRDRAGFRHLCRLLTAVHADPDPGPGPGPGRPPRRPAPARARAGPAPPLPRTGRRHHGRPGRPALRGHQPPAPRGRAAGRADRGPGRIVFSRCGRFRRPPAAARHRHQHLARPAGPGHPGRTGRLPARAGRAGRALCPLAREPHSAWHISPRPAPCAPRATGSCCRPGRAATR